MVEIDWVMLGTWYDLTGLLAVQLTLAVAVGVLGYSAGRQRGSRAVRVGLPLALLLAAAACGATLFRCAEARESTRGRLEGRIPGQFLDHDRAQNHLAMVADRGRQGIGVAAATGGVSALLYYIARRTRRAGAAEPIAAPDPAT